MTTQIRELALSDETLADLERQYKTNWDRRVAERNLGIILKAKKCSRQEIADFLLITTHTVSEWLHCYVTEGLDILCQIDTGDSAVQLTDVQLQELETELDRRLFSTAAEVAD